MKALSCYNGCPTKENDERGSMWVIKRDGRKEEWNSKKIEYAVSCAANEVGEDTAYSIFFEFHSSFQKIRCKFPYPEWNYFFTKGQALTYIAMKG